MKAGKINLEERLRCLETKVERLEMENSTEKSIKQSPAHEITCEGKISDQIDKDPCVMQEKIKIFYENEKMPVGRSSELKNNTSDEGSERYLNGRLKEISLADGIQKDTMERKRKRRPDCGLTSILTGSVFFFPAANLADSEAVNNQKRD